MAPITEPGRITSAPPTGEPTLAARNLNHKTFNPRVILQKPSRPDPWTRAETWRYTGPFTRWNRFKGALPGLGTATVAFAAYCVYEQLFMKDDHHDHHGHSESH